MTDTTDRGGVEPRATNGDDAATHLGGKRKIGCLNDGVSRLGRSHG